MWDNDAKTMAVNVIAKVEGGGAWDAINYNDPITLGLMQWYGTRAADLLARIQTDHPTEYATIAQSVRDDMTANVTSSRYWTSRYLNLAEGNTIKPVLRAAKDTQGSLVASDVDDYKAVCDRIGLNADTNTDTAIFFMCMYHQSPARAINLMKRIGMGSSLDRTYSACINETVFKSYRPRYTQARDIIKSGIPPTIIDLNDENTEQGDSGQDSGHNPGNGGSIFDQVRSGISRLEVAGDQILIHLADGKTAFGVPTGGNNYLVRATYSSDSVPPATPEPGESTGTPNPSATGQEIVDFMVARTGAYGYSQGPGRLTPETSGVTDCSALTRYAYLSVTGVDIGTYTDAQVTSNTTRLISKGGGGNSPNEGDMQIGDLVLSRRYGTASNRIASHVEIYMGDGKIIGHGGVPYMGPVVKDLAPRTADKQTWWVKRLNSL